jgi:hypothetical protein
LPAKQTTLLEEMSAAARGVVAVLIGDRRAPSHFDFSQRGLVGSFVAFLVASLINALTPVVFGLEVPPGLITRGLILVAVLYAAQIALSALVLRQLGRLDGLVPYLVADNWATFFITLVSTLLTLIGVGDELSIIGLGILVIIVEVNIARLIVTLPGLQIAMFLIAQLVGVSAALIVIGVLVPGLMPDFGAVSAGVPPAQ